MKIIISHSPSLVVFFIFSLLKEVFGRIDFPYSIEDKRYCTIICPLADKWSEYYDRATLWYTVVYIMLCVVVMIYTSTSQILVCFLSTYRVSLLEQRAKAERTVDLLCCKGSRSEWNHRRHLIWRGVHKTVITLS